VAEGRHLEEPALGHAAARARVGSYATALFEDLPTDRLEEIEDELFRFARTVEATPALRSALIDANLPVEVRQAVVDQLLDGKVQPATLRLVRFVLDAGRTRDFVGSLDWLVQRTAEARGWRVARVRAALELESTQRERLEATLGRMTGSPVELQITLDPHLLGGAVIEIGDLLVDATARGRLDSLREHLLPEGWDDTGFGRRARGAEQNAQVDAHEEGAD
jgi:F-type H+-transporting ATPase subunit delta